MEIYRKGDTSVYDGTETANIMSNFNNCGCDECYCYEDNNEDDVCGAIHDTCPDWSL